VLLIEDDSAVTTLVEMSLETRGAEVISVSQYSELESVLAGKPVLDAVLLDLSPLEGKLEEAVSNLLSVCPGVLLILVSGQPGGVPPEVAGKFAAWVRKPFDMDQLTHKLGELLSERR
jgi:DNA-binding NtrC family response regulator